MLSLPMGTVMSRLRRSGRGVRHGALPSARRTIRAPAHRRDLSEGMLAHAKEKNVYDELTKAALTEYLRRAPNASGIAGCFAA
jgi:predicted TPR repeat methyltransferase